MGVSQGWPDQYIHPYSLYQSDIYQRYETAMTDYLNRDDVRRALNVYDAPTAGRWADSAYDDGRAFDYVKQYDACNYQVLNEFGFSDSDDRPVSMVEFYRNIVPRLDVSIVYNGDSDPCVSYEGTREAIREVGFPLRTGGEGRPWFFADAPTFNGPSSAHAHHRYHPTKKEGGDNYHSFRPSMMMMEGRPELFGPDLRDMEYPEITAQLGGYVTDYQEGLSFVTIHGAGHMVPQVRPRQSVRLLRGLLDKKHLTTDDTANDDKSGLLSPLYENDEKLSTINDTEFLQYATAWTHTAKNMALMDFHDNKLHHHPRHYDATTKLVVNDEGGSLINL